MARAPNMLDVLRTLDAVRNESLEPLTRGRLSHREMQKVKESIERNILFNILAILSERRADVFFPNHSRERLCRMQTYRSSVMLYQLGVRLIQKKSSNINEHVP